MRTRRHHRPLTIPLATAMTLVLSAAPANAPAHADQRHGQRTDNVVIRWNQVGLDAVITARMGPPVVARAMAILHTCIYDAWAAYDRRAAGTRLGTRLRRPPGERTLRNKNEAMSYAAYTAAIDQWPGEKAQFDALMADLGYPGRGRTQASAVGTRACGAVLDYRHHDGANQLGDLSPGAYSDYTGYKPVNALMDVLKPLKQGSVKNPNRWQPLTIPGADGQPVSQTFTAPQWGNVKPFAMTSWNQFKLPPPARIGSAEYVREARELVNDAANLDDRRKVISEHWADEGPGFISPPGTWSEIGQWVSHRDHHSADDDAKMFFALTNAVFDASIGVWGTKTEYDSVRPITSIRYLFQGTKIPSWSRAGSGPEKIDGASWLPYQPALFITPAFAEYPSGHSAFGGAAAEVLKLFTGSDRYGNSVTVRAGSSRVEPGVSPTADVTLSWPTFSAAEKENGLSRRYGGLHFKDGDLEGRSLGRQVGATAWAKASLYFAGITVPSDDKRR
jgi:hypothetical protein